MATSGSVNSYKNSSQATYYVFEWSRTSYSVQNNTSTISWKVSEVTTAYIGASATLNYSLNIDGNTYSFSGKASINKGEVTLQTGTTVISHNADGAKTFSFSLSRVGSGGASHVWLSGTGTLDSISRPATIITAPDFNDEENPTITYSNPFGEKVTSLQAGITFTDSAMNIPYRDISKTGTSYTFELTNADRLNLRQAIKTGNSIALKFRVKTVIDGETHVDEITKTCTLINYEPTLAPTVRATDTYSLTATGDSTGSTLIRYISDVRFDTGAAAKKNATIEYHTITCGGQVLDDYVSTTGTMANVESNTFYFSVTDSRGYTTRDAVVFSEDNGKFIPYVKITCRIKSTFLDANGNLTVTITGKYYKGSFGALTNAFDIDYSIRDEDGNYITDETEGGWNRITGIDVTVDEDSNYTYSFVASGLDYNKQHTLEVYAIDMMANSQISTEVIATVPVFDWGKDDFKHNTDVIMEYNKSIVATRKDGSTFRAIEPCNGSGNTVINWDSYDEGKSDTEIYGNNVKISANDKLYINGRSYGENTLLWSGASHMNGNQTITLNDAISNQPNGIVLIFSYYETSTGYAQDVGWSTHFVPKYQIHLNQGGGQSFLMGLNAGFGTIGAKYLYIYDTKITGQASNTSTGTNSGITFKNSDFVLRYVIGV